jgi:hypothetical protein
MTYVSQLYHYTCVPAVDTSVDYILRGRKLLLQGLTFVRRLRLLFYFQETQSFIDTQQIQLCRVCLASLTLH